MHITDDLEPARGTPTMVVARAHAVLTNEASAHHKLFINSVWLLHYSRIATRAIMTKPLVELFVKASSTDPGDKGADPFSQKWFMVLYILVERQLLNLRVIPVSSANPPDEYTSLETGKRIPALAFYSEHVDGETADKPDFVRAGNDELEEFVRERYSEEINVDAEEQWIGADLLRNLNQFLRTGNPQSIIANLATLNEHLLKVRLNAFKIFKRLICDA